MSQLFEPYTVAGFELKNRFMRSATTTYYADEQGNLREGAIQLYENLAIGDVGLIIKGHLGITEEGRIHQGMAKISSEKNIPQLAELTRRVHGSGGTIIAQINHGGIRNLPERIGPSQYHGDGWTAREMTESEIYSIIDAFGDASERAIQAGFDGVQIHCAHGYILSQFLSREVNKRQDKWGGSLENRMRLLMEVYRKIRKRIGKVPVMIKINCDDFSRFGFTIDECQNVCTTLTAEGIDLIEISGGGVNRLPELKSRGKHEDPKFAELTFAGHASKVKKSVGETPVALVEGFTSLSTMNAVLARGIADIVSLSRPFIREPDLVQSLKGSQDDVSCIRCDACSGPDVFSKMLLQCHLDP
ncbi:MAG: oxidoreductase [Candidatus Thorarchaeota archaeon]|jgi:2,4-dienoyl-CoA reductase-like NADH-dependent reductase (Old Yellow Enzyme family)